MRAELRSRNSRFFRETRLREKREFFAQRRLCDSPSETGSAVFWAAASPDLERAWEDACSTPQTDWLQLKAHLGQLQPYKSCSSTVTFEDLMNHFLHETRGSGAQVAALDCLYLATFLVPSRLVEGTFLRFLGILENAHFDFSIGAKMASILAQIITESHDNLALNLKASTLQSVSRISASHQATNLSNFELIFRNMFSPAEVYFESATIIFGGAISYTMIPAAQILGSLSAVSPLLFHCLREKPLSVAGLGLLLLMMNSGAIGPPELTGNSEFLVRLVRLVPNTSDAHLISLVFRVFAQIVQLRSLELLRPLFENLHVVGQFINQVLSLALQSLNGSLSEAECAILGYLTQIAQTKRPEAFELLAQFDLAKCAFKVLETTEIPQQFELVLGLISEILALEEFFRNETLYPYARAFDELCLRLERCLRAQKRGVIKLLVRLVAYAFDLESEVALGDPRRSQTLILLAGRRGLVERLIDAQMLDDPEVKDLAGDLIERYLEFVKKS